MQCERWDALRGCISEGRSPSSKEVDLVAAQIWQESLSQPNEIGWKAVPVGSASHSHAVGLATLALGGSKEVV
jgi:hypothetical protein